MGSLSIPANAPVYVDTNCIIYTVQQHPDYLSILNPLWLAQSRGKRVLSSDLSLMESLVLPIKTNDHARIADFDALFNKRIVFLLPISQPVLREAARLRASHTFLRTPDAIHAATALAHGCGLFVTNDVSFRRVPGLPVAVLDDLK